VRLWRLLALVATLPLGLLAFPASTQALNNTAKIGMPVLTYVCPNPFQIDFSWTPAANAVFYSLELAGPLDATANGGVSGTYLRQFGTIELAKGAINSASVSLSQAATASPSLQQWQVMAGGPSGYVGIVSRAQVAQVIMPCTQTTPLQSPYF
jgi:hypothetical protein